VNVRSSRRPRAASLLLLTALAAGVLVGTTAPAAASGAGPPSYPLTVDETGLPNGTLWAAEINGVEHSSRNATIEIVASQGFYSVFIGPLPAWSPNQSSFQGTVTNAPLSFNVTFTASSPGGSGSGTGGDGSGPGPSSDSPGPLGVAPGVWIGLAVVLGLGALAVYFLTRPNPKVHRHPEEEAREARHAKRSAKAAERRHRREGSPAKKRPAATTHRTHKPPRAPPKPIASDEGDELSET
jgi:hypothetical protein